MQQIQMHNFLYKMMMVNKMKPSSTRNYSTEKVQLLSNIIDDLLYEYEEIHSTEISQILNKELLLSGKYVLSMPKILFLDNQKHLNILFDIYSEHYNPLLPTPEILYYTTHPNIKIVILTTKEDIFMLMGLARLLLILSGRERRTGKMWNEFSYIEQELYSNLQINEPVDRLYKIDLKSSEVIISNNSILDSVAPLVGEGSAVYKLISSFLNLYIVEKYFYVKDIEIENYFRNSDICDQSKLVLPFGVINKVLFHIVLMDLDREFKKRFPSVRYYRLIDEIYILTNDKNSEIFDEKAGYALLEELGYSGQIDSITPGYKVLPCRRSWDDDDEIHSVQLYTDRRVHVHKKTRLNRWDE